jgi:hypothetical protein
MLVEVIMGDKTIYWIGCIILGIIFVGPQIAVLFMFCWPAAIVVLIIGILIFHKVIDR